MYHYAFYAYCAYKVYEYSSVLDYALSVGRGVKGVYDWVNSGKEEENMEPYLDWVLIVEDEDSPLKKIVDNKKG